VLQSDAMVGCGWTVITVAVPAVSARARASSARTFFMIKVFQYSFQLAPD
jgi:hypothetical protein